MEIRIIKDRAGRPSNIKLLRSSGSMQNMIGSFPADATSCPAEVDARLTDGERRQLEGHFRGTRDRLSREAAADAVAALNRAVEMRESLPQVNRQALVEEVLKLLAQLQSSS